MKTFVRWLHTFALILLLYPLAMVAQEPPPPALPPGPLIQKHAPNFAAWTMTVKCGDLDALATASEPPQEQGNSTTAKPLVTVFTFTKTESILHVLVPSGEKTWNVWNVGSVKTLLDPEGKTCGVIVNSTTLLTNPFDFDFTTSDFPGSAWISLSNYTGIKTFMGRKCIQFKTQENEAYIDFQSRLPVALGNSGEAHFYQFLPPPTTPLSLPAVVQKLLDQRKSDEARYAHVPLSPF